MKSVAFRPKSWVKINYEYYIYLIIISWFVRFSVPLKLLVSRETCNRFCLNWFECHSASIQYPTTQGRGNRIILLLSLICWHEYHLVFYGCSHRNLINYKIYSKSTIPFNDKKNVKLIPFKFGQRCKFIKQRKIYQFDSDYYIGDF